MAVLILTDYSNLVYDLARSERSIPFGKNAQAHNLYHVLTLFIAYFPSNAIGKTQETGYIGRRNQSMHQRCIGLISPSPGRAGVLVFFSK